jgi:PAS domain S-box-containing protein
MSTADLMRVLDDIADPVVRLDGQAKYVSMNRSAEEAFRRLGRDPVGMIGKSLWEVFPAVKGSIVEHELRRALEDEAPIHFEFLYPADQHWYEADGFPASPGVVLIFRDITSRKNS